MRRTILLLLCVFTAGPAMAELPTVDDVVEGLQCANDQTQGYTLYLPSNYDPKSRPPALLVFDPRSRSRLAAELFESAARRFGWIILSSDNTMSDGPMEPNLRAIKALWPEAITRYGADPRRIYASGFSGGAHVSYFLGQQRPQLAGVIACGGRLIPEYLRGTGFVLFATAGTTDFNLRGMQKVSEYMAEQGRAHRLEIFEGAHQWMPKETAELAVAWMELQAMRGELRETDEALAAELLAADMTAAKQLEDKGDLLSAYRRYMAIEASFDGVVEVVEAGVRADDLGTNKALRKAEKLEQELIAEEDTFVEKLDANCMELVMSAEPIPAKVLSRQIGVTKLKKRAGKQGMDAVAAQRMLNLAHSVAGFYLARDLRTQNRPGHAVEALRVALTIREDDPHNLYNLACALAQAGEVDDALDALQDAMANGLDVTEYLDTDHDLDPLRQAGRFLKLREEILSPR